MNLIIPGLARTGTKSLWRFFNTHYQVTTSKVKEPLRINQSLDHYFDNFDIDNRTKMIFDGTPELTNFSIIHDLLNHPQIEGIYQIWLTRDPIERIKSLIKRLNKISFEDLQTLPKISFNVDMEGQLNQAKNILGKENIFVSDIRKVSVERHIERFLGIEETNICIPWDKH